MGFPLAGQGFDVFELVLVHISPFPWHAHAQVSREASCACAVVERGALVRMRCSCTVPPPASQSEAAILQREPSKRALSYIVELISGSSEHRVLNANSDALISIVCTVFES